MVSSARRDTKPAFEITPYHRAIFDFVQHGRGDAVVDAVPGSGKTSILVEVARRCALQGACFVAFNRHIVHELQGRLPRSVSVKTIHQLGRACVGGELDKLKYRRLITSYAEAHLPVWRVTEPYTNPYLVRKRIDEALAITQLTLTDPDNPAAMLDMAKHFGLDLTDWQHTLEAVRDVLDRGVEMREAISFDDMVWLPSKLRLTPRRRFSWLFVDEAQDLNAAQLDVVLRHRAPGGRVLFVGDSYQAIYGWAGADVNSIRTIVEKTHAKRMPLSVSYRCPKKHIARAALLNAQVRPHEMAAQGLITVVPRNRLAKTVRRGELIICRTTAPLIEACFQLIQANISAKVRGVDIGKGLLALVEGVARSARFRFVSFLDFLERYAAWYRDTHWREVADGAASVVNFEDELRSLEAIYLAHQPETLAEMAAVIESLFSDSNPGVWLSTMHKAKGLESDRVFILQPSLMPHPSATSAWERQQGRNLMYLALTRSRRELFFVLEPEDVASKNAPDGSIYYYVRPPNERFD